jgi:hypothetical protein
MRADGTAGRPLDGAAIPARRHHAAAARDRAPGYVTD